MILKNIFIKKIIFFDFPIMEKIKRSELVYAKNYIDGHTPYTVEKQQYDSWVLFYLTV